MCKKKIRISFHTKKLNILIYLHYSDLFLNIVSISIPRAIFSYALIFFRRDLKLLATGMSRSECGMVVMSQRKTSKSDAYFFQMLHTTTKSSQRNDITSRVTR